MKKISKLRQERHLPGMAHTYTQIYIHAVFAVEGRQNLIKPEHNTPHCWKNSAWITTGDTFSRHPTPEFPTMPRLTTLGILITPVLQRYRP
jgi:hypothetical protein